MKKKVLPHPFSLSRAAEKKNKRRKSRRRSSPSLVKNEKLFLSGARNRTQELIETYKNSPITFSNVSNKYFCARIYALESR